MSQSTIEAEIKQKSRYDYQYPIPISLLCDWTLITLKFDNFHIIKWLLGVLHKPITKQMSDSIQFIDGYSVPTICY